jgi:hypothetical protein
MASAAKIDHKKGLGTAVNLLFYFQPGFRFCNASLREKFVL